LQGNNLHIYGFAPDFRSLNDKCAISERSFGHFSREYIIPGMFLLFFNPAGLLFFRSF